MAQGIRIVREGSATQGAYRALTDGGEPAGELTWLTRGQTRIATRTYVPPERRGHGIAGQLVEALMEDARTLGFTVVPQCSYVAAAFRRHPEWAGLLAEGKI